MLIFSLFLLVVGGIFRYAIEPSLWADVNEDAVGAVLLIVGAIGAAFYGLVLLITGTALHEMTKPNVTVRRRRKP